MRVVYLGTGEIGVPSLSWLHQSPEIELVEIVTQPDRPAGRGNKMKSPPIMQWATKHGLAVLQPESVNTPEYLEHLASLKPELIVVCAFGQILRQPVLQLPTHGCINIHASLLPRHRGASCIQAALLENDDQTGITIIQMDAGLDTGDCLTQEAIPIRPDETASSLHDRLAECAPVALAGAVSQIRAGSSKPIQQDEDEATYAPKLSRQDGEIDWFQPVQQIERRMRALYSWPGSYTFFRNDKGMPKRLKIIPPVKCYPNTSGQFPAGTIRLDELGDVRVAGTDGEIALGQVQPEGAKFMSAPEWTRGYGICTGQVLSAE